MAPSMYLKRLVCWRKAQLFTLHLLRKYTETPHYHLVLKLFLIPILRTTYQNLPRKWWRVHTASRMGYEYGLLELSTLLAHGDKSSWRRVRLRSRLLP